MKYTIVLERTSNNYAAYDPHPALRATLSQRERV